MPSFSDVSVPVATTLGTTDRLAILQSGTSKVVPISVLDTRYVQDAAHVVFTPNGTIAATTVQAAIQEVRDEAGSGGGVTGNTVTAADNTSSAWSAHAFGNTPLSGGIQILEARLLNGNLVGGIGIAFNAGAVGYISAVNVPKSKVYNGGQQTGTTEPSGMVDGEIFYYWEP